MYNAGKLSQCDNLTGKKKIYYLAPAVFQVAVVITNAGLDQQKVIGGFSFTENDTALFKALMLWLYFIQKGFFLFRQIRYTFNIPYDCLNELPWHRNVLAIVELPV